MERTPLCAPAAQAAAGARPPRVFRRCKKVTLPNCVSGPPVFSLACNSSCGTAPGWSTDAIFFAPTIDPSFVDCQRGTDGPAKCTATGSSPREIVAAGWTNVQDPLVQP